MPRQLRTERSSSRPRGTVGGAESTTQLLLDTAAEVFGKQGFSSARVADIARRCGLSTGAIYSRWLTKQELFLAVVERKAVQGAQTVFDWGESSASAWLATVGTQLPTPDADMDRSVLLEACVIARRDPTMFPDLARLLDIEATAMSGLIAAGKAAGEIDEALSTEAIVFACQSLGLGVRLAAAAAPGGERQPSEADWRALVARFIASIRPPGE